jgi:hypothetical protein
MICYQSTIKLVLQWYFSSIYFEGNVLQICNVIAMTKAESEKPKNRVRKMPHHSLETGGEALASLFT